MDDNNLYVKQQAYLNTCSDADDSTSFPSFPWFPENNRRRKSRLGTHRNQTRRVFQDPSSNDGDHFWSNKENFNNQFSRSKSPSNFRVDTQAEDLKPSSSNFNGDPKKSPLSLTSERIDDEQSPFLTIPVVFDDRIPSLVSSFEKSKNTALPFPPCLAEDEIDGILKEINSSDKVRTPLFPLSSKSNRTQTSTFKLEKSRDAQLNQPVTTNQFQTAEIKLNKSFSGELPNDVSFSSPFGDLDFGLKNCNQQTDNVSSKTNIEYDDLNRVYSIEPPIDLSILSSNSKDSSKISNNLSLEPVINDLSCMNSDELPNNSSSVFNLNCKNHTKLSANSSFESGINESGYMNSIQFPNNSSFITDSGSKNSAGLLTNSSPESAIGNIVSENSTKLSKNSSVSIKTCFSEPVHPQLPFDLSSMQDQENVKFQKVDELSTNQTSEEMAGNTEFNQRLSSTELKTESMSISSVVEIPSTVKLLQNPVLISSDDKISDTPAMINSNLEQKKTPDKNPEVQTESTPAEIAPKPIVQFVEPLVTREFVVPRNLTKIPAVINVKGKSFKVLNVLGTGGSSVVYQVSHPETNELLAVKKVELPDEDDDITDGYLNEVQMLENLQNCDVIIKIFDHQLIYKNGKKTLYVVMEKGDTDLSRLIKSVNESKKLSIPMIIYYWTEMLEAVNEVHRRGIIHSDLKPANFVLVRGRLKLIDFGIASSIQGDMTSVYKDSFCGTLNYMSPEATCYVKCPSGMAGYKITFKTDVWSLGCILYNLVYGRLPFHHIKKRMEKIYAIVSPSVNVEFPEKNDVPPILISLLKSCLEKDYKRRPTVQELLDRTMRIFQCNSVD